jgi:hypothetical protein
MCGVKVEGVSASPALLPEFSGEGTRSASRPVSVPPAHVRVRQTACGASKSLGTYWLGWVAGAPRREVRESENSTTKHTGTPRRDTSPDLSFGRR